MSRLSNHHEELNENGEGKCSVPMWSMGCPAGFCDKVAYGKQEPGQRRYGEWSTAWGKWFPGYCSGLACYGHGGPKGRKHLGDPCHYCGVPHDEVESGVCLGRGK